MATMTVKGSYFPEALYGFNNGTLKEGEVIRDMDGTFHLVQYVNTSGAYVVPLSSITRQIAGRNVDFTAGGRTISAYSIVEVVNPLTMGGNSQEYRRYAKMVSASGKVGVDLAEKGTTFGSFDQTEVAEGATADLDETDSIPTTKGMGMAKKTAKTAKATKKANGSAAREKTPKTVRQCVCGCGTETTGRFAPGHDARFHGWIKKLADGRILRNGKDAKSGEQIVGNSVLNKLGLVAKGEGFKATTPEYYKND